MIETSMLENILFKCHIIKEFAPLPKSVLGYYYFDGNYYLILINENIRYNERLYRTVLSEELGHYRTTIGDITPRKYMCYGDRLEIDKKELMALKWATNFLIPTDILINVLKNSPTPTLPELADYFYVTHEFLMQKLEFMARENLTWNIDDNRLLSLHSLPSVGIYQKLGDSRFSQLKYGT